MLNANTYVTSQKGIGGTIRNQYEDFYVEEIPEIIPDGEGPNVYVWIEKLGRTTLDVVLDIVIISLYKVRKFILNDQCRSS